MKKSITLLALALLSSAFSFAQTVIWQNSVTVSPTAGKIVNSTYSPSAQQFVVSSPYTSIQEIVMDIYQRGASADYLVSIYNDNGSNQIGTKFLDILYSSSSNFTLYSNTALTINNTNCLNNSMPLTLVAGNKYWVVFSSTGVDGFGWYYDIASNGVNGIGASNISYTNSLYRINQPFFMKITAGAPAVTALDKITSDEVSVEAVAKTISINSVFENYTVELINVAGTKVLSQHISQRGSTSIATDVTKGIYIVKVSAEGRCFTKKVFLQ